MKFFKFIAVTFLALLLIGTTACTPKPVEEPPDTPNGDNSITQNGENGEEPSGPTEEEPEVDEPAGEEIKDGSEESDPEDMSITVGGEITYTDDEGNVVTMHVSDEGTTASVSVDDEGNETYEVYITDDGQGVTISGDGATIESESTNVLPEIWPDDLPLMEEFLIDGEYKIIVITMEDGTVNVITDGMVPISEVEEFYASLPDWEITDQIRSEMFQGNGFALTITRDDLEVILSAGAVGAVTSLTFSFTRTSPEQE